MGGWVSPPAGRIKIWTQFAQRIGCVIAAAPSKAPLKGSRPKAEAERPSAELIGSLLSSCGAYAILPWPGIVILDVENKRALSFVSARSDTRTIIVATPGGGLHLAYRDPTNTLRGQVRIWDDVDLVATEGSPWFVLGPGSCRDGKRYEIIEGEDLLQSGELPVAPAWLYVMQAAHKASSPPRASVVERPAPGPRPNRTGRIAAAFPHASKGKRHGKVLDLAVSLRAAGADRDDLDRLCVEAGEHKCDPPLALASERKEVGQIIDWAMETVDVRWRQTGDILDAAVRHTMNRPTSTSGDDAYEKVLAVATYLGQLPDPVFGLPQKRIGEPLDLEQCRVSRKIERGVKEGRLVRETNHYRIGTCSKLYRLPGRVGESRPARIEGIHCTDDVQVRVVFDADHWCYRVVPLLGAGRVREGGVLHTTGESSPKNMENATVDRPVLLAAGLIAPTAEEIVAFRMAIPYAGPDSDFAQVTLGELRARRPTAHAVGSNHVPAVTPPVPAKAPTRQKTTARPSTCSATPQPATKSPRRWESGTREPVDEVFALYDSTQPGTPTMHQWAWPELADHVRSVCGISVVREDLVEIIKRLRDFTSMLGAGAYVDRALAMAIDVIVTHVVAGRTHLWRDHEDLCDRTFSTLREHVPRPKRVETDEGWRTVSMARPTLHHALAILAAHELLSVDEIQAIVAARYAHERHHPPRRQCRRSPVATTPRKRTLEEYRMVLAMEQLPGCRVKDPDAGEARLIVYRELLRTGMVTAGFERLGRLYEGIGRKRCLKMPVEHAVWILMRNGAGWGLRVCTSRRGPPHAAAA